MQPDIVFAIPGNIASPTGGYAYDRQVLQLMPREGLSLRHLELPSSYPFPDAGACAATRSAFDSLSPGTVVLIDGLAFGAMPLQVIDALTGPIVALVHHPLAYETGLGEAEAKMLFRSEQIALARASRIIVTGEISRQLLRDHYGVSAEQITLAIPGTEPRPPAKGTRHPLKLLAVGAISPRKGYVDLIDALGSLGDTGCDWNLDIVGSAAHAPGEAQRVSDAIGRYQLEQRIVLHGAVSDAALEAFFDRADVFVLASRFEGFGMVLTEALARGLPIVTTKVGAADQLVPDGASLKVLPGDHVALQEAISKVICDVALRRRMALEATAAAAALPRWTDTVRIIAQTLREVLP